MLINQFTRFMLAFAKKTPLVLILDDVQWADPASIEVLFHLGRQLQQAPLVLIGAYRLDEVRATATESNLPLEKVFAELKRVYGDVWIDLDAVNAEEGHDFVAAVVNTLSHRLDETFIQNSLPAHTGTSDVHR